MIDSLQGTLLDHDESHAIVDVGGVRFRVEIPGSTAVQLPAQGEPVTLLTRLSFNPNEGSFALFGFSTPMERQCYEVLLTISGIGPKKALAILSQVEVAAFARAVIEKNLTYFSGIKGVGRKTAERLLLELSDKMFGLAAEAKVSGKQAPAAPAQSENIADAVAALIALGCPAAVAQRAVASAAEIAGQDAPTEELIREGLRHR
ncbi:MAG: Holliday junction branch migration protein RuvA [Sumerlaeia bacterium]